MHAPNPRSDDRAAFTYGWDTAFGIPIPDVNHAIVAAKSSPAAFRQEDKGYTVSADFGDWQVTVNGSGRTVRFSVPLADVVLVYTATKKRVTCPSGCAVIEVDLHYVPHDTGGEGAGATGGKPFALKVKDTPTSPQQPVASVPALTLARDVGGLSHALIQQGLDDWLNRNLAEFDHVFGVVDLDRQVDRGRWGFVTPSYTSYAYLDGEDLASSRLGVLTMTGGRTGEKLSNQLSPNVVPPGSEAGFLVSQKRALADLVRPGLELAYPGLDASNFLLNDAGTRLYLKDGVAVSAGTVSHKGKHYHPVLKQLSVEADGEILTLKSYTETEVAPGITARCTATNWYRVELGTSKHGQTLKFVEAQKPDIEHSIHQSEGSIITQLIIEIVAAVALVILTIVTDGAALVVGGLIVGLILGADQILPDVVKDVNTDDAPSIDLLVVNAVAPIRWTGGSSFELDSAGLNVSLQLGGDPKFPTRPA